MKTARNTPGSVERIPRSHQYVKPAELGQAVGRSRGFIYERMRTGEIACRRVAGALRIPLATAITWIEKVTE